MKVFACLAILLSFAACGGDSDEQPVIGYERDSEGCSKPAECLTGGTERHDVAGVQLIHKRIRGNPWIAVRVMLDPGYTDAKSAQARAMVMQLIDWYGSLEFVETWQAELSSIGATVFAGSGADYATVSLLVPAANVGRGFQLLAAAVNNPPTTRLSPEWFESFRSGYAANAAAAADDVDGAARIAAWSLFGPAHPYARDTKVISSVELWDLESAADVLHESPMTVTVVGDISLEGAITRTGASFSRTARAKRSEDPPEFTPSPDQRVKFVARRDAPATHVYADFRVPAPTDADYPPLELGLRVLSSRLFEELRTRRGLVYAVGVDIANYRRSYGYATLSTTELPEATAAFRETLQQLVSDGIDAAELEGMRAQYMTEFYQTTHSVLSLSWILGNWQMTSGDWRLAEQYMERIAEVDPGAAREAVERYVRDMRYGVAGPRMYSEEEITGSPPPPPDPCKANPTMCGCPKEIWSTEVCNGRDDDCDGQVDESRSSEICNGMDDDCDDKVDENKLPQELCNAIDDDCDGMVDESNGNCTCVRAETCDQVDNDCDGRVDEGFRDLCGVCPSEYTPQNCPGHTVFISSIVYATSSFGSVAGADAQCQSVALTAGRSGVWRALIGDANARFDQHIQITRPVYNTTGQLVAVTPDELFGGSIRAEIVTDETGRDQPWGLLAWIGPPGADCVGWTSKSPSDLGSVSHVHKGTGWGDRRDVPCDSIAVLFCIDQNL